VTASRSSQLPERIGRFEVTRPLGSGGMGIVYAAHDPVLDREVAVKLLRPERFRADQLAAAGERLHHEAQVTAKLAHPNVVTIFDVGKHEGSVYIAMELVDGPSLYQWLASTARPWREVLTMFFHAGRGLAAAHGVGLVHRDFKPSNVLVGADRRPRVVDFGLAHFGAVPAMPLRPGEPDLLSTASGADREIGSESITTLGEGRAWDAAASGVFEASRSGAFEVSRGRTTDIGTTNPGETFTGGVLRERIDVTTTSSSLSSVSMLDGSMGGERSITSGPDVTTTGLFVGTPAYMAPELFTGAGADARTDQFAFSVAVYEGIYGERPFAGKTAREVADNVLAGRVSPAPARSRVPGWLRAIVLRGLSIDPNERYASLNSQLAAIAFTSKIMWE
jgi:serine/threonine protein kinase